MIRNLPTSTTLPVSEIRPLDDDEFGLFQAWVHREAGIYLGPSKKELLVARLLRRLRARGQTSFLAYYRLIEQDAVERTAMLDCISTNETHFFREPRQFEFLEAQVFPALRDTRNRALGLRVWSAGCSTGEEPYSLAMTLLDHFPGWPVKIFATDLSTQVLDKARSAIWTIEKAEEIPRRYRKRFMLRGTGKQHGKMKAGPEIRSMVQFERLNLYGRQYPPLGRFDLIFCRNVLIYFNTESRQQVIKRLLDHLAPGGILFLGHAETLNGLTAQVRSIGPNTYTHADPSAHGLSRPIEVSKTAAAPGIPDEACHPE